MPFKRLFKVKYAGSSPENASVVRTLFNLFFFLIPTLTEPPPSPFTLCLQPTGINFLSFIIPLCTLCPYSSAYFLRSVKEGRACQHLSIQSASLFPFFIHCFFLLDNSFIHSFILSFIHRFIH